MRRKDRKLQPPANRAPAPQPPKLWNIRNAAGNIPVIELFGDIGRSKAGDPWWGEEPGAGTFQEFAADLKKIGNVPELRVEIYSYGGSVTVGKGMHDKLLEHPANKTAVIYGICASAATYVALACQKVQIPANSFFLIHNSTGMCYGTSEDMQQCAEMLDIADESIANLYVARTGKSLEEIQDIMDRDTWMSGTEAVEIGLADEVIEPITITPEQRAAPANLRPALLNSMPSEARGWFDMPAVTNAPSAPTPVPMKPRPSPLMNVATETPPAGGGAAPVPPAAPVAPVVLPANAAPVVAPANAAPAAPVTPVNVAPTPVITMTPAELQATIANAVQQGVAAHIANQSALAAAGITPQNIGGAPAPATPAAPAPQPVNTAGMSALQLINLGRKKLAEQGQLAPAAA